jgi:hypothetical protein
MLSLIRCAILSLWLLPLTGFCDAEATVDNAGIYSEKRGAPEKELIELLAPKAKVTESREGKKTIFLCEWPDVSVKINVDPDWDLKKMISGMKLWIASFPPEDKGTPSVATLLHQLDATVDCYGCEITPHYDAEGKAAALVLNLAAKCHGLVFSHLTFYDSEGNRIIGADGEPVNLRNPK